MNHIQGSFTTRDGLSLFDQAWLPDGEPRCGLIILHGVCEHSGRYHNLVETLVPQGVAVLSFDLRGHGRSPGRRVYIDNWQEYLDDIHSFIAIIRQGHPNLPLFLYGHSLGSVLAMDYLQDHSLDWQGAVLSALPMSSIEAASPFMVALARFLSGFWPTFTLKSQVKTKDLARDAAVVQAYENDPLVFQVMTVRWGTEYMKELKNASTVATKINLPLLVIQGKDDRLCEPDAAQACYDKFSSQDKTFKLYPDRFHEVHNDFGWEEVVQDIGGWLEGHLQSVPSA
jgi:alpha-beta hydrolase superfamily lysophospholipase